MQKFIFYWCEILKNTDSAQLCVTLISRQAFVVENDKGGAVKYHLTSGVTTSFQPPPTEVRIRTNNIPEVTHL